MDRGEGKRKDFGRRKGKGAAFAKMALDWLVFFLLWTRSILFQQLQISDPTSVALLNCTVEVNCKHGLYILDYVTLSLIASLHCIRARRLFDPHPFAASH